MFETNVYQRSRHLKRWLAYTYLPCKREQSKVLSKSRLNAYTNSKSIKNRFSSLYNSNAHEYFILYLRLLVLMLERNTDGIFFLIYQPSCLSETTGVRVILYAFYYPCLQIWQYLLSNCLNFAEVFYFLSNI